MKRVLLSLIVLAIAFVSFGKNLNAVAVDDGVNGDGIAVYQLTDASIDTLNDSITPSGSNVYGPIPLIKKNCDQAQYVKIYSNGSTLTGTDTAIVSYIYSSTPNFADIVGSYTVQAGDTIVGTTGKSHTAINASATAAKYLFVKVASGKAAVIYLRNKIRVVVTYRCH